MTCVTSRVEHPYKRAARPARAGARRKAHPLGAHRAREHRRFHQPLQIDDGVVPAPRSSRSDRNVRLARVSTAMRLSMPGTICEQRHVARVHDPVDLRRRKARTQGRRRGNPMNDVAERAEADDQEAMIHGAESAMSASSSH